MKKLISLINAVLLFVITVVNVSAADVAEYEFRGIAYLSIGDVNADTKVTSTDLVVLRKKLLSSNIFISSAADLNYDEKINLTDLVRLKKKMAGVPLTSIFEKQATSLKTNVLNAADSLPATVTGKIYHVSAHGSASADGSENSPYSYAQLIGGAVSLNSGNTYAQLQGGSLGVYGKYNINDFGLFVKDTINYNFGDSNAKVYYY